jgi:hypothetical protein
MRTVSFALTCLAALYSPQVFAKPSAPSSTLFQARGLQQDHCYQESASLTCRDTCSLTLWPLSQGQITLNVEKISEQDRKALGHFFRAKFKVLNQRADAVAIIKLSGISAKELRSDVESSTGQVRPANCKR